MVTKTKVGNAQWRRAEGRNVLQLTILVLLKRRKKGGEGRAREGQRQEKRKQRLRAHALALRAWGVRAPPPHKSPAAPVSSSVAHARALKLTWCTLPPHLPDTFTGAANDKILAVHAKGRLQDGRRGRVRGRQGVRRWGRRAADRGALERVMPGGRAGAAEKRKRTGSIEQSHWMISLRC